MRRKLLISAALCMNRFQRQWQLDDIDLISLDVFETLIIRPVVTPNDLYEVIAWQMKEILPHDITPAKWREIRYGAEREARVKHAGREITLQEIYEMMDGRFDTSFKTKAMAIECKTEESIWQLVDYMRVPIDAARRAGKKIAFLSDMYLPEEIIKRAIIAHGFYKEGDLLLVSSTQGAQKSTSKLFQVLMDKTGVPARRILHQGDNPWSDLAMPMTKRVRAKLFEKHELNRYEQAITELEQVSHVVRSIAAGTSRAVRLSVPEESPAQSTIVEVSASVAGPFVVSYVLWVLIEAQRLGIKHLYFMARDGQIMTRVADILAKQLNIPVSAHYFYGSRQSLFLPALDVDDPHYEDIFVRGIRKKTLKGAAALLNLPVDAFEALVESVGITNTPGYQYTWKDARSLAAALKKSPLLTIMQEKSRAQRAAMAAYFETVGIFDQAHLGVVDTGWVGNVQVFLTDAIRKAKPGHVFTCTGFYVYLRRQPDARAGGTRCYSRNARAMITGLVELFTAADHGSVKAYDKDAPNFVRLSSEKNKEGLEWGLPVQQSVIESYARIFANMTKGYPLPLDTLAAEIKIVSSLTFSRFFLEPTTQEAVVYGSYPHADDPAHLIYHELAPVFNLQQMFRRFILKDFLTVSHWPAATILRSCRHYLLYLPAGYVLYCIRRRKEKNRKWML